VAPAWGGITNQSQGAQIGKIPQQVFAPITGPDYSNFNHLDILISYD
jgi:hypothetical protein